MDDMREEVRQAVEDVLVELFELDDPSELDWDGDFEADLGGDSLLRLEVIVRLERRLRIKFDGSDAAAMTSASAIAKVTGDRVAVGRAT